MSEVNPYASPIHTNYQPPVVLAEMVGQGLYRKGRELVMHKQAVLPDRCVKSNEPANGRRLRRNLYWHHPAIYLTILISLLIYIILALILQKRARIDIGLSDRWFRKRRRGILIAWLLFLVGVVLIVVGCASSAPHAGWAIPVGLALALFAAIYGLIAARLVVPARITNEYVWLKGVHPDFLATLPPWPYNP